MATLNALRAFEAAARHGSFVAAAGEIGVSPAAVSQQVRGLEARIGRALFTRVGRRVVLTEAGLEVLPRLSAAFQGLAEVAQQLSGRPASARLTLSVPPSFALSWLSSRVQGFIAANPGLALSIRAEEDPIAFERDKVDLRLSYGRFHYPEHRVEELMTDQVLPLCSPALATECAGPEALLALPLIHTDWGPSAARYPSWRSWCLAQGLSPDEESLRGHWANSSKLALDLAASGAGVVLGQRLLAADLIAAGHLVCPLALPMDLEAPYCLSVPRLRAERAPVVAAIAWLKAEMAV
ncbi:MAG: LysR substrate-binding domain-containing protein [Pseudomonadota bacterium]